MRELEELDKEEREGVRSGRSLRQIPAVTGRFLALLASSAPPGVIVEAGTSAGYSALWLSLAARATNRKVVTFEAMQDKAKLARETFDRSGTNDVIEFVHGDARSLVSNCDPIAFCFVDVEKDMYGEVYDAVVPKLVPGGWLVADNAVSHEDVLARFITRVMADRRVDAVVDPIGRGLLLCRKTAAPRSGAA
jgi:predicted O-methyltransferase YrrM